MNYKNIDFTIEDVSVFVPAKSLYKQTFKSPIEYNKYKNDHEKTDMLRLFKWRLVVSVNMLIELADAGLYELDTQLQDTGTEANKITTLTK